MYLSNYKDGLAKMDNRLFIYHMTTKMTLNASAQGAGFHLLIYV